MQRRLIGMAVMVLFSTPVSGSYLGDPTHFVADQVWRYTDSGPNEVVFKNPLPKVGMTFTSSASGLLMYLEKTEAYGQCHDEEYSRLDRISQTILSDRDYCPESVPLKLHICDASGTDKYVIPIEQKYGTYFDHGVFYGESFVGLQDNPGFTGQWRQLFVDLKTGKRMLFSNKPRAALRLEACASPDDSKLLCKKDSGLVYLNGTLVLPYHDADPLCGELSPAKYKEKKLEMEKELATVAVHFDFERIGDKGQIWSEDSRYFALLDYSKSGPQAEALLQTSAPRLLIVDTERVGAGKLFTDFTVQVPIGMEEGPLRQKEPVLTWDWEKDEIVVEDVYPERLRLKSIKVRNSLTAHEEAIALKHGVNEPE